MVSFQSRMSARNVYGLEAGFVRFRHVNPVFDDVYVAVRMKLVGDKNRCVIPSHHTSFTRTEMLTDLVVLAGNKQSVEYVVDTLITYGLTYLCPSYHLQAQLGKLLAEGSSAVDIEQWLQDSMSTVFHNKPDFLYSLVIR